MDRRGFLQRAGVGSIALASLPTALNALATPVWGDEELTNFHFMAVSKAATVDGVDHTLTMAGSGRFNPSRVVGGGSFTHTDDASPVPKTLIGSGTWKALRVVNWTLVGTYGVFASGVLDLLVALVREIPSPAVIPATLKVVCNVSAGGLQTGQPEGFALTVADVPFGPFMQQVPAVGLTVFSTRNEDGS